MVLTSRVCRLDQKIERRLVSSSDGAGSVEDFSGSEASTGEFVASSVLWMAGDAISTGQESLLE